VKRKAATLLDARRPLAPFLLAGDEHGPCSPAKPPVEPARARLLFRDG
jgi:hypothetical protein